MSGIQDICNLIKEGCYMCTIDLKDAYYSVKIHSEFQCFLKFQWKGILYKFTCFPNGLGSCPRLFTKITKVPFSHLRLKGIPLSGYIDDIFTKAQSFQACFDNMLETISLLDSLGFVVHPTNPSFYQSRRLKY